MGNYVKISEHDHVRVWGKANLTYNSISEKILGSIDIIKIEIIK